MFARQDAERQARADAEAAQFEQMLKLRDDARKERDAQLSQAKALLDLEASRAGVEDRQGAQMKTAKSIAPALGRTQMLDATTGSDATAFVPGGAPDNLLGVLQQLDAGPAVLGQFVGGAEDQLMAPIVSRQRAQAGADAAALGIGRDEAFSNIQVGAGLAQSTAERVQKEELDAEIEREKRAEERAKAAEIRQQENAERKAAENDGKWEKKDLVDWGTKREKYLDFLPNVDAGYKIVDSFGLQNPLSIVQAINVWQKNNDEGGVVRGEDIQIATERGAPGFSQRVAEALSTFENGGGFTKEFVENLRGSLRFQLELLDEKADNIQSDFDDYADQNEWSKNDRAAAFPRARSVKRARDRIASRAPVQGPSKPITADQVRLIEENLRYQLDRDPTDEELSAGIDRFMSGGI